MYGRTAAPKGAAPQLGAVLILLGTPKIGFEDLVRWARILHGEHWNDEVEYARLDQDFAQPDMLGPVYFGKWRCHVDQGPRHQQSQGRTVPGLPDPG